MRQKTCEVIFVVGMLPFVLLGVLGACLVAGYRMGTLVVQEWSEQAFQQNDDTRTKPNHG